jgi:CRISPR-associated protein Cmr2
MVKNMPNEPFVLIAADVDRVSSYVFESAKLAEMRGASLILDLLNVKESDDIDRWGINEIIINSERKQIKGIPQILKDEFDLADEHIIYAAGGSALILAPADKADAIKNCIEKLYVETTLTATITVVCLPVGQSDLERGIEPPSGEWLDTQAKRAEGAAWKLVKSNLVSQDEWKTYKSPTSLNSMQYDRIKGFGQIYAAIGYQLRRAKDSKTTAPVFEVSPFTERCAYCHFRPAYDLARELDERPICRPCRLKRNAGEKGAGHSFYIKGFREYLTSQVSGGKGVPYLEGITIEKRDWSVIKSPPDLEAVAQAATGKAGNYVGIIYADGNDMGAVLESLKKVKEFSDFAKGVRAALGTAVFSSLGEFLGGPCTTEREHLGDDGLKHKRKYVYHPFEIVSIGGDDVYLFVPADIALEIAARICRRFEQECEKALNKKLSLSAGVLIAHVNTPIYFSRAVVKGLLKNAKSLRKQNAEAISTIDFQVITTDTAATEEITGFRKKAYRHPRFDEGFTTRPLALNEVEELIKLVRHLKEEQFPRSQLYLLREAVTVGPQPRATNFYYYQQSRSDEMRRIYRLLHDFLQQGRDEKWLPFWDVGGEKITPIVDIVEIYDFVRGAEGDKQ